MGLKLYNIFESIILEEINRAKSLLTEGVSEEDVKAAINGKYNVNIVYRDPDMTLPSKRYIQVYNFSETKGGNLAIRAYQIFGGSKTTPREGAWKIFRLDRIEGWYPTSVKWSNPISDTHLDIPTYNQSGDRSMNKVIKLVDPSSFRNKRSDLNQKKINKDNTF